MNYSECFSKIMLEVDILSHHTYKGHKMYSMNILPESDNLRYIKEKLITKDDINTYLNHPLNIYVVYNKRESENKIPSFELEKLDVVLSNLDDKCW